MDKRKIARQSGRQGKHPAQATATADPRQQFTDLIAAYHAGQFEAVISGASRFTRQWPEQVVGWNLLAEGYRMTGRLDDAEAACRHALRIDPRGAEAYNNLGNALRDRGDSAAAEAAFRQALSLKPELAEAHYNLGNTLRSVGRLQETVISYRDAIACRPREFVYHCALGVVLKDLGELESARSALEQALSLRPDHAETHVDLGNVLRDLGLHDRARKAFVRAIELQPELVQAHNNLGNLLRAMGDMEQAEVCFRQALQISPRHTSAWYNLAMTKKFATDDEEITVLERMLAWQDLTEVDRIRLRFALGKALADIDGDAGRIFTHYSEGCRLKRQSLHYEPALAEREFERVAACCTEEWLRGVPDAGDSTEAPILVVGMPRSGTTLIEQILSSHARVHGAGERKELGRLVAAECERTGRPYPEWVTDLDADRIAWLGGEYRRLVIDPIEAQRVVDKMPTHFRYLGLIAAILPHARIIHVQRDPVDTCLSCFMHLFSESQSFSYDLTELGRYYRAYSGLMDHWRRVLPAGRMLEISYEELVSDPEPPVRRMLDHCGLEWDPACLEFHRNSRSVTTASVAQVRQPLYRSAVGRWRKYRAHLRPLFDALGPLAPGGQAGLACNQSVSREGGR